MRDSYSQPLARDAMAYVLAGGRGSRLLELTDKRAKPAVYFGGMSRIVDFALSNAINSGIRRIGVATQYKAHSLIRHMQRAWNFMRPERNESFDILPASQRIDEIHWYEGTADAVYQNIDIIESYAPRHMVILAGDHIYKMDYELMLQQHVNSGADVTVGCMVVPRKDATGFGVMAVDGKSNITDFVEKPKDPPCIPGDPDHALASMGIYVFSTRVLYEELARDHALADSSHDFGRDIIPALLGRLRVFAYPFRDPQSGHHAYWRDVGTVDSFWEANMELIGVTPELNLYDADWPIWTWQQQVPPAKFVFDDEGRRGMAVDSLVSGGCVVSGAAVRRSLLFSNVRVHSYAEIDDTVVFPEVDIGRHCRIRRAVIDTRAVLPPGTVIGYDHAEDARRFHVSPGGVVLVTRSMLGGAVNG